MHLTELPDLVNHLGDTKLARLMRLNIRHVEQLGSLLVSLGGRYALTQLGFEVVGIQQVIEPALRIRFGLSISQPLQKGDKKLPPLLVRDRFKMGFATQTDPFREATPDSPLPDPPPGETPSEITGSLQQSERLLDTGPPPKAPDQGRRGTCVAFTVTGMHQYARIKDKLDLPALSPQYLYYCAKADDGLDPDEDGTSLDAALRVLLNHGCCPESDLEYYPRHEVRQIYTIRGHSTKKAEKDLKTAAGVYKIVRFRPIARSSATVKAELDAGNAVGLGIGVYELAWYSNSAQFKGDIGLPPFNDSTSKPILLDNYLGGHAILVIGYRDNDLKDEKNHRPGGGYFIFRNSWGENWAPANDYARGYGELPYEYVDRFCLEAAVIDGLPRPSGGKIGLKVRPKRVKKTTAPKKK